MKHKWHKEIKAWADGVEIEYRWQNQHKKQWSEWESCNEPKFYYFNYEFRIKPQPKEPQYLYVWENQSTGEYKLSDVEPHPLKEYVSQWKCIGKIKLEVHDE